MTIRIHLCRPYEIANLESSSVSGEEWQPIWFEQYLVLREECFRKELGISGFSQSLDRYDLSGYLLLVIADGVCVGGVRLNEATIGGSDTLPLESDNFMLNQIFPELNQLGTRYAQWTRLAVHEAYRSTSVLSQFAAAMSELSVKRDHHYCFNISGAARARFYRKLYRLQGIHCEIRREVEVPVGGDFKHLDHILSIAYKDSSMAGLDYQPQTIECSLTKELIMAVA